MPKYDNSDRLKTVGDKDWCEALDELTTYLRWRLRGKTQWGAHSESVLETPALDYYTEEAAAKMLEGCWKSAEESYNAFGTTREEHQKRMLAFIHKKQEEVKKNLKPRAHSIWTGGTREQRLSL